MSFLYLWYGGNRKMKKFICIMFIIILSVNLFACGEKAPQDSNVQSIMFPVSDNGKTEFNALIYEIEPFNLSLTLPDKWTMKERKLSGEFDTEVALSGVWSTLDIFNDKNERVGAVGYNIYELYEGAEDEPNAIYNQIALGNDYQFDVRNSYNIVKETDYGKTATADVYYSASINNGEEKINKGILSYNKDLLVYVAIELINDLLSEEELLSIAQSIDFVK